ncbi:hypothetical protein [Rubellicoccus peritrichatus]|uniref:Uncharacterized protein n=1 Tax=Rubellicoccus peritrichatus TaxID=3080537 RepID=A0AAQ3LAK1_9BACT|nr:hypothetical protein [Puniceicoccus sp. CR14]WOO41712.1 hypothetical protein RZN69_01330 [Puniceicoccus sp. CR14]
MVHQQIIGDAYAHDLTATSDQKQLTARYIEPQIDEIVDRLRRFREEVDQEYAPKVEADRKAGQSGVYGDIQLGQYPIGFCRHIRERVLARMVADSFFQDLVMKGLTLRRVFIFLRGIYFQNAIQLGNYYLDAANDTVFPEKPKLDWAPISELDYENLDSWERFAAVSSHYLKVELYPNFLFPLAFPATPFFAIRPNGRIDMLLAQYHIAHKDLGDGMRRTLALLNDTELMSKRLPDCYLRMMEKAFGGNLFDAFPLEFAPSDPDKIKETVVAEFIQLMDQPNEKTHSTMKAYFELVEKSVKIMRTKNLIPDADELKELRQQGLIPQNVDVIAGLNVD